MFIRMTADQTALVDQVRRFATSFVVPFEDERGNDPDAAKELLRELGAARLLGLNIPEQYGGVGLSHSDTCMCIEEMGKYSIDAAWMMAAASVGQAYYIYGFGSEEQKNKYLPAICRGEYSVAIGITEPEAGTASTALRTSIDVDGDQLRINGYKHYVSNVPLSDLFIVYGRIGKEQGAKGIGAVLVDRNAPGFSIGRYSENMGDHVQADLIFEDCVLPADAMLVPQGSFAALSECYNLERCGGTAVLLGIAMGSFEQALEYTKERKQFGKSLVEFQAVQLKLADMATQLHAARLMLHNALDVPESTYPDRMESSMVKVFGNEAAKYVTDTAIQLFGGAGYLKETGIERRYRVVRGYSIAGGALDIHRTMMAGWLAEQRFSQWA